MNQIKTMNDMIKEITIYTVKCDRCGKDYSEGTEYCGWNNKEYAEWIAINSEWVKDEERHYCHECAESIKEEPKKNEEISCKTCKFLLPENRCDHINGCEGDYEFWQKGNPEVSSVPAVRVRHYNEETEETEYGTVIDQTIKAYVVMPDYDLSMNVLWWKKDCDVIC